MKFSVFIAIALTSFASADDEMKWTNPIVPQRADPQVLLQSDGNYYLAATVPNYDAIELRRAKTIDGLSSATPAVVWKRPASGLMSGYIWAPELHHIDGKWYVYFAAGDAKNIWNIRMFVLENASPDPFTGTWTEKGQIKMNWESFTLDATVFKVNGTRYLSWAQGGGDVKKGTAIYIAKMDTPWSISGKQVLITRPEYPWEKVRFEVNEAPSALVKNGRVFLTYSAAGTGAEYCLGMLTADEKSDLLDPASWKKSPTPVFKSDPSSSQYGPGHNSFTTSPDGKTDILVYHSRNYEKIEGDPLKNHDRATRAQILQWNADGTPNFGTPVADGPLK
ncbi:MAG: glycoside hydrolase family 43 protein [Luteolibacter sp.]